MFLSSFYFSFLGLDQKWLYEKERAIVIEGDRFNTRFQFFSQTLFCLLPCFQIMQSYISSFFLLRFNYE